MTLPPTRIRGVPNAVINLVIVPCVYDAKHGKRAMRRTEGSDTRLTRSHGWRESVCGKCGLRVMVDTIPISHSSCLGVSRNE